MNREDWKAEAPPAYERYTYTPIKMTDEQMWAQDLPGNYEKGVELSAESEHQLVKPTFQSVVQKQARSRDFNDEDLPYMAYSSYQKDTPDKYLDSKFAKVSMTEEQMRAYDHKVAQEQALKLAKASEHQLAQRGKNYFRVETDSKILPYVVRDHAWTNAQEDKTHNKEWFEETTKLTGKKNFVQRRAPGETKSTIKPYVVNEHAWTDSNEDKTHDKEWLKETEKQTGWKPSLAQA